MRSQWGEMWPLAYLIGVVFHLSVLGTRQKILTVRQYQVILPGQPGSSIPFLRSANDTQRCPQQDGGPQGSNTNVNIAQRCLVMPWSSLTKTAIRNAFRHTSLIQDTVKAWEWTQPGTSWVHLHICYCLQLTEGERNNVFRAGRPLDMSLGL